MTEILQLHPDDGRRVSRRIPRLDGAEAAAILRLASPIAMVALVNMAMSVTDTVMVASFGTGPLAAVAVASDFYSIVFYFAASILGGLAPAYAAASAANDALRLRRLRSAGWIIAGAAALIAVPAVWASPAWLVWVGIAPELLAPGAGYARAMALTLLPMLAVAVLRLRLTAIEQPGQMLRVTLIALPLNAVLNHLAMHGVGTWQGLGVTGAGVASLVLGCFIALCLLRACVRAGDAGCARVAWAEVAATARVGLPIGVATVAEVGVFLGATLYVATLSAEDVAAHALALRMAGITYAASLGLLQATMTRVARAERSGAARVFATSLGLSLVAGAALFAALMVAARPVAVALLGDGREAAALAVSLIMLLALAELFGPLAAAAGGLLRGLRDTRPAMICALAGNWGVAAPLGIWLSGPFGLGAAGVWTGLAAGSIAASLGTVWCLRSHWRAAREEG